MNDIAIKYYNSFRGMNGKEIPIEQNKREYEDTFWESILKTYQEITIKIEEIKQFGNVNEMIIFDKKIDNFFINNALTIGYKNGFIDSIINDNKKPKYNEECKQYYNFFGKKLTDDEMREAKRLYDLENLYFKKLMKYKIYDLYSKSLRRIGNYYKKNKQWYLALLAFEKIKEFGFKGITDGKNIIICNKEIILLENKKIKANN